MSDGYGELGTVVSYPSNASLSGKPAGKDIGVSISVGVEKFDPKNMCTSLTEEMADLRSTNSQITIKRFRHVLYELLEKETDEEMYWLL